MTLEGFLQIPGGVQSHWAGLQNSNSFKLKERKLNKPSWWHLFTCSISLSCIPLLQYLTLSASCVGYQDLMEESSLAKHGIEPLVLFIPYFH